MFRVPPFSLLSFAVAALLGCVSVQALAGLPGWPVSALVCAVALLAFLRVRHPAARHVAAVAMFAAWAAVHAARAMDARLPVAREGEDIVLTGRVVDLPRSIGSDTSFVFDSDPPERGAAGFQGRLRLTWFRPVVPPRACQRWRLTVRLRRPRGTVNPGGSDAERNALQRGIAATGYVRASAGNQRLPAGDCVDGWRSRMADAMDRRLGAHDARIVKALAVGDTRGLDAADWDIARATGVSHLIAISGFHVGVAAGGGVVLLRLVYAALPRLALAVPRPVAQAVVGFVIAGGYGVLAGMGLPTLRSLLMIAVVMLAGCARRRAKGATLLACALLVVLVISPLSVLSAGFWLSFAGVGFLMLCVGPRSSGWRGWLGELLRAQAAMSIVLLPMSLWWFGSASLVGFLANLVAAPLVSFAVVPLVLLGCALLGVPVLSAPLFTAAAWLLSWQWRLLAVMADWPAARVGVMDGGTIPVLLATLGAAWLFAPRGLPLRGYGAVLFLPLVLPPREDPPPGAFRAWVLDVGQGLAVVVHTRTHTLVYDTGPAFANGGDAGAGVLLPSVTALGVGPVDTLVVSHGDNDHAGGAASVVARYPAAVRWSGEPGRLGFTATRCTPDRSWAWDGVRFRFMAVPAAPGGKTRGNDRSCVLAIDGAAGRLLLTGDIGNKAERRMDLDALASPLPVVTTVAHHGSRHSSDARWLAAVAPELAIVSAGWRNRFGHPHPSVVQRYGAVGATVLETTRSGAIRVDFPSRQPPRIGREWRRWQSRYWRE